MWETEDPQILGIYIPWSYLITFIEDDGRWIQNEKCIAELTKGEAASIDNTPDLSSIWNQTSHQCELESTKQSEYSEAEIQHKYIRYDELTDKAKLRTCNDYALKNFLSQASQREILVPTEKDMGIREYIKNYREIQTVSKSSNIHIEQTKSERSDWERKRCWSVENFTAW